MTRIIVITGPTASGKSGLATQIFKSLNEPVIINADASQVYDFCPILSNQPIADDYKRYPHLLYGFLDITNRFSIGKWLNEVENLLSEYYVSQKRDIIIVGGTCMYIYTLLNGISEIPDVSIDSIRESETLYNKIGHDEFLTIVRNFDNNPYPDRQRLIRSYCLFNETGHSLSYWQNKPKRLISPFGGASRSITISDANNCKTLNLLDISGQISLIKIIPDREALYQKCNERFLKMLDCGGVEEVEMAIQNYGNTFATNKIIGYNEVRDYIFGNISREECIRIATQKTRNYAKSQFTWLRNKI